METLNLPKAVLMKEIIRYEEDMYILNTEVDIVAGWEIKTRNAFIRIDIKALSEILRLENPSQATKIEDILLNMLSVGEPPRIDIKELTGDYLRLCNSELILKSNSDALSSENIHDLLQIVDVFPKFYSEELGDYLNLEKEFSKDILEKTFSDFQKTFYLMDRGYDIHIASSMTHTNNPIAALIYHKIKQQLDPEESIVSPVAQRKEDILEENYSFDELTAYANKELPF